MGSIGWLVLYCVVAVSHLRVQGQVLPTNYEYYTEGGVMSGVDELPDGFLLNGKNITLLSGAMHYFRIHPDYWRDRLRKLRAMGANTVETYVPWNLHEPVPGKYDFGDGGDDMSPFLDIIKFVRMAQEEDLLVIVRPGPFICAEFEFGGMPSWLLREQGMLVRSSDPRFEELVDRYFSELLPPLVNLQFSYGGPIIAFQIENEYGATKFNLEPLDQQYLIDLHQMMKRQGLKEMFFTSDTPANPGGDEGFVPTVLQTANFKTNPELQLNTLKRQQPTKPSMVMEFWTGWFDHWMEETHHHTTVEEYATVLEEILAFPASVNLYMYHGGTTWGFFNGANVYPFFPFYEADVSSYDYDAPLSEAGDYTDKYLATQVLFDQYNPVKTKLPAMPAESVKVAYPAVPLTEQINYDSIINQIPATEKFMYNDLVNMEALEVNDGAGQSYGYVIYRKAAATLGLNTTLTISGRAHGIVSVIVDGVTKSAPLTSVEDIREFGYWIKSDAQLEILSESAANQTLDLLVENFGRNNFGRLADFDQRKGLYEGPVLLDGVALHTWEVMSLQLKNDWIRGLVGWESGLSSITAPALFRGTFSVADPQDTFLDMRAWGKGVVFINGFNLGRYFDIGPLRTLYLPAPLVKTGLNEIVVFEQFSPSTEVVFSDTPILGATEPPTTEIPALE